MIKRETLKRIWRDNVWGNVIAGVILAISFALFSSIITLLKGIIDKIPLNSIVENIKFNFFRTTTLPNWIIYISSVFVLTSTLLIFKDIWRKILRVKEQSGGEEDELDLRFSDKLPLFHYGKPMNFFQARLGKAFPAIRDEVKWYYGRQAIDRLEVFFQKPLLFKAEEKDTYIDPIWWFRGGSSMYIESFKRLSKTRCLMNIDELVINKIAVHRDNHNYRHFIYVEVSADKPSGAYEHSTEKIKYYIDHFGYMWEEFGLLNEKPIMSEEYHDGSAEIKGKIIDAGDAKLRVRYLTPYNFVITPRDSPYNSNKFDMESKYYLNGLLNQTVDFSDFIKFMEGFKKN